MKIDYAKLGKECRLEIVEIVEACGRGHIGAAFSIVEILNVLFEKVLRFDASRPDWPERDRLILSKGHGCLALYPILARKGYFPRGELFKFCKPEGILGGHPDHRKIPGVEASTGSLGHGLSVGIGMAVAARMQKQPYYVYVILGDGECNEGSIWEGALSAAHHGLENLVILVDYNKMQSYGFVKDIVGLEPFAEKWRAFGFAVAEVDMNSPELLEQMLLAGPAEPGRPRAVICHTTKGKGAAFAENNPEWHHKAKLSLEEAQKLRAALEGGGNA